MTSNVKKLIENVFDENVSYNFKLVEKLKNIMLNSKQVKFSNKICFLIFIKTNESLFKLKKTKLDKFIPDNDLNTDNSWLEYAMVKYQDEGDKFF